ncbi:MULTISPECIES: o-succinylbenzoate synthase [unclassified Synechocystis]|uniref:o-succinylbenzoate synthase n=1 Tax=unclassified Synechocystis TaxID=2640012 RepID=UPI0003FB63DC|nr:MULTISPECIES: o-succinylbenzoate synthase [unclassified Synechocystis]AIE74869.1 O-succinylbenzoate synthase [Synechocystis sp. PCC 6714]MCT0253411.1 o-succinylbenzoate synthase [Synechocystis sp. CS-94]
MGKSYQVNFYPYNFSLPSPVVTAHGTWRQRQGLIVQLADRQGRVGRGEIAPLPWFGTEDLASATNFCRNLHGQISPEQIGKIGDRLPCCGFAFGSGEWEVNGKGLVELPLNPLSYCQLLPTGKKTLDYLTSGQKLTASTVKWKIAVNDFPTERDLYLQLLDQLEQCPGEINLRLDANGGLDLAIAQQWLQLLDRQRENTSVKVQYLEQPLPAGEIDDIFRLQRNFVTPIALDEAVCSLSQLQALYDRHWPGIYILKAAIMGDPRTLADWLNKHPIPAIFSSVFETAIARHQVLTLAQRWNLPDHAVGFAPPREPIIEATPD